MRCRFLIIALGLFVTSCSNLEVFDEQLPEVEGITPETMVTSLPVFNIETDPLDFNRVMAGYHNKIIKTGEITFLNTTNILDATQRTIEYQIRGRSSVGEDFPLKSLGVTFDQPVKFTETAVPKYNVRSGHNLQVLSAIRFRSSGNDFGKTMLKDLAYARLASLANLDLELMYGEPVQVFVNNNYYGLMNARTESDVRGMAGLLDVDPSLISLIKVKDDSENFKFHEGDESGAETLLRAIEEENAQAIEAQIDVPNFIDYIIFQDYIGNADWANNIKAFNVSHGKFRFILYDLDLASNASTIALIPKLEFLSADIAKVYRALQENEDFNDRLENRKKVLYQRFSTQEFNKIVDGLASQIENEIPYLIAKYGRPESTLHWKLEVENLKLDFAGRDRSIRKKYNLD